MAQSRSGLRSGFTLVELLVVITIIGVLIALLLPAVQAAREAARRSQCSNNFKQVGLAMLSYHDSCTVFPPGMFMRGGSECPVNAPIFAGWGWGAFILPYLEKSDVYDRLDFKALNYAAGNNWTAGAFLISAYLCPSDLQRGELVSVSGGRRNGATEPEDMRMTNMSGVSDSREWKCVASSGVYPRQFPDNNGILGEGQGCEIAKITDGTSQTLLVGEFTGGGLGSYSGQFWMSWNIADTRDGINGYLTLPGGLVSGYNMRTAGFSSYHPGGCHFLLADGSVHFLSQTIDRVTLAALTTRAGDNEPVISGF